MHSEVKHEFTAYQYHYVYKNKQQYLKWLPRSKHRIHTSKYLIEHFYLAIIPRYQNKLIYNARGLNKNKNLNKESIIYHRPNEGR